MGRMAGTYIEVVVTATCDTEEALADFLFSEGALGLVTEDLSGNPPGTLIRASFPGSLPVEEVVQRLRRYQDSLRALGFSGLDDRIEVHELPIVDWARMSAEQFEPIDVGRRLTIAPPSHPGPFPEGRLLIRITPAMAFGTGYSPTTRMCLEGLEDFIENWRGGRRPLVLDVGTGTGILAIASAALGARRVVALDTDPQACAAARENLALHAWADRIQLIQGGIENVRADLRFDLILANLDARVLPPLLPALAILLARAGRLVVGGIALEEEVKITAALLASGLQTIRRRTEEGWLCLTLSLESAES
jgi:ribosomal protein L11 methyltransferase